LEELIKLAYHQVKGLLFNHSWSEHSRSNGSTEPVKESINLFVARAPLTLQTWTKESRFQIQKESRDKGINVCKVQA